jgi:hypothetical protein
MIIGLSTMFSMTSSGSQEKQPTRHTYLLSNPTWYKTKKDRIPIKRMITKTMEHAPAADSIACLLMLSVQLRLTTPGTRRVNASLRGVSWISFCCA